MSEQRHTSSGSPAAPLPPRLPKAGWLHHLGRSDPCLDLDSPLGSSSPGSSPSGGAPAPHRVMSTAVSWLATPFSGMALPWPLRFTMDFCHLQKLSRDFPAWWVISRVG